MVKSEERGNSAEVSRATEAKELCRVCFRGRWPVAITAMDSRIASWTRVPCPASLGFAEHQFIDFRCCVLGNKIQHPKVQCKSASAFRLSKPALRYLKRECLLCYLILARRASFDRLKGTQPNRFKIVSDN